jgi:membrane protease YdiL (CAAX protease family)
MSQVIKKSYLAWSHEGRSGFFVYLIGTILVLAISLFIGQIFSVIGAVLIHSNSVAATIIKVTFFGFIFSFLSIPILLALLHKRPWWGVAMPEKRLDMKRLGVGLFSALTAIVVINLAGYLWNPSSFIFNGIDYRTWVPMLFLCAISFFVQASTEEMVYRGYITQFVYRFTQNPIFFLGIPALVFSLPHFGNITGANGIYAILPYIEMGLLFGWMAYRSGSLWTSIGAHLANNWFITLFVGSTEETVAKISLFSTTSNISSPADQSISTLIYCIAVATIAELLMRKTGTRIAYD